MKVLLIRPPAVSFKIHPALIMNEPLGLLYLAAYLRKNGVEVAVIDGFASNNLFQMGEFYARGISYEELSKKIAAFSPDIVGIGHAFTQYSKGTHDLARIVKDISKDILVVCGGQAASASFQEILNNPNFDLVVVGEGEETLLEVVRKFENKSSLQDIAGTAVKVGNQIKCNSLREFIKDLDTLELPARDLLDMSQYYNDPYSVEKAMRYPRLSIVTSRGCPFNCVFCSIHSIWRHTYRARSAENVVDEIEYLCKDYGAKEIIFYDDNMTFDKTRMNRICDEIVGRKIDIRWSTPNGVAIWTLDKDTLKNMRRSGCYKITFGLESGSPVTRRFIHKDFIDLSQAKELIKFCNKIGLWTLSSFIIGFPYETKTDVAQTLNFAIDSDVDVATFYAASPYPGTELYNICKREGLFKGFNEEDFEKWVASNGEAMLDMQNLSKEDIDFLVLDLKKKFFKARFFSFLNPLRIIRKIDSIESLKYVFRMLKSYLPFLKSVFVNS